MLRITRLLTQVGIVRALRVDPDRVGPVVELIDHPALIKRQIQFIAPLPTVALDRVETLGVKLSAVRNRWESMSC